MSDEPDDPRYRFDICEPSDGLSFPADVLRLSAYAKLLTRRVQERDKTIREMSLRNSCFAPPTPEQEAQAVQDYAHFEAACARFSPGFPETVHLIGQRDEKRKAFVISTSVSMPTVMVTDTGDEKQMDAALAKLRESFG